MDTLKQLVLLCGLLIVYVCPFFYMQFFVSINIFS